MENLIMNRDLTLSQVPSVRVTQLDPGAFHDGSILEPRKGTWSEIWAFALTFNGYTYFGESEKGGGWGGRRLGDFNDSVHREFKETGQLPRLQLGMLRGCLFYEQRRVKWNMQMTERYPEERAEYLDALLGAIRQDLSS